MEFGSIKIADDADFRRLKAMCINHEEWRQVYNKNNVMVWTKSNDLSDFNMVKIYGSYDEISADVMYDVIHDPIYRKLWDRNMIEGREICRVGPNSDVGYYALAMFRPLMNRDFVTQRSWLDLGKEKLILNHSVNHESVPPRKNFVRGISYLTGYFIIATNDTADPTKPGCQMTYITQCDPKGKLPVWAVNMGTTYIAPKVMVTLQKACEGYQSWKAENSPTSKSWRRPEQSKLPMLDIIDIGTMKETSGADLIDETDVVRDDSHNGGGATAVSVRP